MTSKLVYWPADVLKKVSSPLIAAPELDLVSTMQNTMKAHQGAGLSAVQIGVPVRLIVVDSAALGPGVFVNPVLLSASREGGHKNEGCLSVPGFFESIWRHDNIRVTYRDEKFELHENVEFQGFIAQVLQHEMEHLDGKMYLDHLSKARRSAILGNMQKLRRAGKLR
jgi:peptide deformylase